MNPLLRKTSILTLSAALLCAPLFVKKTDAHWGNLKVARYGATAVVHDNAIYVIGGSWLKPIRIPAEKLDLVTGKVKKLPWDHIIRRYHTAEVSNGQIWVSGGEAFAHRALKVARPVEQIDPATGETTIIGDLKYPRKKSGSVLYNDRIILIGGSPENEDGDFGSTEVEIFNPGNLSSMLGPAFPEPLEPKPAVARNRIFVLGGWNETDGPSSRAYFLGSDLKWHRLPDLPHTLSANAIVGHGDYLFSFGDYTRMDQVARYQISTQTWTVIDVPYTPRRHACAVIAGDRVYVIGGNTSSRRNSMDTIESYAIEELVNARPRSDLTD